MEVKCLGTKCNSSSLPSYLIPLTNYPAGHTEKLGKWGETAYATDEGLTLVKPSVQPAGQTDTHLSPEGL